MSLNWPSSPTTGDTYTAPTGASWVYTGYSWDSLDSLRSIGATGANIIGASGSIDILATEGATGAEGPGFLNSYLVAYVDPIYGNDSTGALNDKGRPYQSINGAKYVGGIYAMCSPSQRGLIYLRAGYYSENYTFVDSLDLYGEPGVVWGGNFPSGFYDTGASVQNKVCKILGHIRLVGNTATNASGGMQCIVLQSDITLYAEFDEVTSMQTLFHASRNVKLTLRFNKVAGVSGNSTGYIGLVGDNATLDLKVRDSITSSARFKLGNGVLASGLAGNVRIECPRIEMISGSSIMWITAPRGNTIDIIGDLHLTSGAVSNGVNGCISIHPQQTNTDTTNAVINITGDLYGYSNHSLVTQDGGFPSNETININGNLISNTYPIWTALNSTNTGMSKITFNESKITGKYINVGRGKQFRFVNCRIINTDAAVSNSPIITVIDNGIGKTSSIYSYNTFAYAAGTGSVFVSGGTAIGLTMGCINTIFNNSFGVGTDVWGGFVNNPNLNIII